MPIRSAVSATPLAVLVPLIAFAGLCSAQAGELSVLAFTGMPAPGISGPHEFRLTDGVGSVRVTDEGYVLLIDQLRRTGGQPRYATYMFGNGLPLTNLADENTDIAITEIGPDDIVWLPRKAEGLRVDSTATGGPSGSAFPTIRFEAGVETPLLMPDGELSQTVELACEPFQTPEVTIRKSTARPVAGDPIAAWHGFLESMDGASACAVVGGASGFNLEIWSVEGGVFGELLMESNGQPVSSGVQAPPAWDDWRMRLIRPVVVTSAGEIVVEGRLETVQGQRIALYATWIATPGVGYTLLVDPEQPHLTLQGLPTDVDIDWIRPARLLMDGSVVLVVNGDDSLGNSIDSIWSVSPSGTSTQLLAAGQHAIGLAPDERIRAIIESEQASVGRSIVRVLIEQDDVAETSEAVYSIEPDGTIRLLLRTGDPVITSDRPGGPFTLEWVALPDMTLEGQVLFAAGVADSSGDISNAICYTDETGAIRPIVFKGDLFDFEPGLPGGEAPITTQFASMNADGLAVVSVFGRTDINRSVIATIRITGPLCPADTNGDDVLTPADFNAWVLAFNNQSPACDQNNDGICTPADFTAWIANFNAGCD